MASVSIGAGSEPLPDCDVCKFHKLVKESEFFCTNCQEYLCISCKSAHLGSKASRNHAVVSIDKAPIQLSKPLPKTAFCDNHKNMIVTLYCEDHNEVICSSCKVFPHRNCRSSSIQSKTAGMEKENYFNRSLLKLKTLKEDFELLKSDRCREKIDMKNEVKTCIEKVDETFTEFIQILEGLKEEMKTEIFSLEENFLKDTDESLNVTASSVSELQDHIHTLAECRDTANDEVMFAGVTKVLRSTKEAEQGLADIKKETGTLEITFKPNEKLQEVLNVMKAFGTLTIIKKTLTHDNQPILSHLNFRNEEKHVLNCMQMYGCVFLSNGSLLLACHDDGLRLLDANFKEMNDYNIKAIDVCVIDDTTVAVTQGSLRKLRVVDVFPRFQTKKTFFTDRKCFGVDYHCEELYVTCHDTPGNGEVKVFDMNGVLKRTIDPGSAILVRPSTVKVSRYGENIYISDSKALLCYNQSGTLEKEIKVNIENIYGFHCDQYDNILLCGWSNQKKACLEVINKCGQTLYGPVTIQDAPECARRCAVRQSDGTLVVSTCCFPTSYAEDAALLIFRK